MAYARPETRTVTIANGQTTSAAFAVGNSISMLGLQTPSAITGTAITLLGSSALAGTYSAIYDSDGGQVSIAVGASRSIGLSGAEADAVSAWPYLKLVSNASEGADRTFTVTLR